VLAGILGRVAAVDGDEIDVGEVRSRVAGVVDLDEALGVGADLVVIDLVDHQLRLPRRRRRRWRRRRLVLGNARERDVAVLGDRDPDLTGRVVGGHARNAVQVGKARDDRSRVALRPRRPGIALLALLSGDVPAHRRLSPATLVRRRDLAEPAALGMLTGVDHGRGVRLLGKGHSGGNEHCRRHTGHQDRPHVTRRCRL
jgi:hypothetical protein